MGEHKNPLIEFTKWALKWLGKSLVLLALLITIIWVIVEAWTWWTHGRHVSNIELTIFNAVTDAESQVCKEGDYPIFIGYMNHSSKTIEKIEIDITANLQNHSTNILPWNSDVRDDRIVPPEGSTGSCYKFSVENEYKDNPEVSKAVYEAKIGYVRFSD
jgi:hypothetical protein